MVEIEHSFVDFKYMIIGEKLKHLNEPEFNEDMKFDDLFYAKMMLYQRENDNFYTMRGAQKIIDYQF